MNSPATKNDHQRALFALLCEFDRVCRRLDIPYVLFAGTLLGAVRHGGFIPWDDDLDVLMFRSDYERFLAEAPGVIDSDKFFLQKEFSAHWPMFFSKLRLNNTTCLEKFHPRDEQQHQGIYMDIFPCDPAAKGSLCRRTQFLASKVVIAKALYARGYETESRTKKLFMTLCRLLPGGLFAGLAKHGSADSGYVHSFFAAAKSYGKNVFPEAWLARRDALSFEGQRFPVPADYDAMLKLLYGDYMQLPPEEDRAVKAHAILVDAERSYEAYAGYRDGMEFEVKTKSIR
ncbi:MAG: LicD family protein [Clostridia bacterium]|nr:LicD family protein [Clostridia bacterium]